MTKRWTAKNNKILFTYNKTKNNIEKRMIFDAIRNYTYKVNTDDFDEFVTSRIDDLISYEGESIFCATGITSGDLVNGVKMKNNKYHTETLVTHKGSLIDIVKKEVSIT